MEVTKCTPKWMFGVGRLGWEVERFLKALLSVDFTISINIFSNWKGVTDEVMTAARCSHQMSFPTTGIPFKRYPIHARSSPAGSLQGSKTEGLERHNDQGAFGEVGPSTKGGGSWLARNKHRKARQGGKKITKSTHHLITDGMKCRESA